MYKIIRNFLFLFDAEEVHHFSMNVLCRLCNIAPVNSLITKWYTAKNEKQTVAFGLTFKNAVGLAAGFDKNAKYLSALQALGFGFVEIGTVTALPQEGNDKPRLFRLPKDKALINRMGFNNEGVAVVAERLKNWRQEQACQNKKILTGSRKQPADICRLIIGGNIGKNKVTSNENAWHDYETCFMALHPYVDYFVVNVSSPNTPGLRALQEKESLRKILTNLQTKNKTFARQKPILLKIAPDLPVAAIDDVIDLAIEIKLDGLVAANTTIERKNLITGKGQLNKIGAGGLSGLPLKNRSTEIVKYIFKKTNGQIPVVSSGGIFTGADAVESVQAGAALVQVWTGFVYEGPAIVKNICAYF